MKMFCYIVYPVILTPPRNEEVLQGSKVRFDCEADGRPKPKVSWLFKNQSISTNTNNSMVFPNGSLLLYSVQNNVMYEGEYTCIAENEAGQSETSTRYLTVHGKMYQSQCF